MSFDFIDGVTPIFKVKILTGCSWYKHRVGFTHYVYEYGEYWRIISAGDYAGNMLLRKHCSIIGAADGGKPWDEKWAPFIYAARALAGEDWDKGELSRAMHRNILDRLGIILGTSKAKSFYTDEEERK